MVTLILSNSCHPATEPAPAISARSRTRVHIRNLSGNVPIGGTNPDFVPRSLRARVYETFTAKTTAVELLVDLGMTCLTITCDDAVFDSFFPQIN